MLNLQRRGFSFLPHSHPRRLNPIRPNMLKKSFILLSMASPLFAIAADLLPKDVARYIDQREACYHMAGEIPDPSEKERLREVIREINKQCKGLDKRSCNSERNTRPMLRSQLA